MFCNNCGNELNTGDIFCQKCGKRVLAEEEFVETATVAEETPAEEVSAPEEISITEEIPVTEDVPVAEPEYAGDSTAIPEVEPGVDNEIQKPKKSKKKKVITISVIAGILVVLTAVTAFAFPYVKNLFFRTVLSEEDYFKHVVKNNVEVIAESLSQNYAAEKEMYESGEAFSESLQIEVGDKTKDLVRMYGDGANIDWLDRLALTVISGFTDGEAYTDIGIKLNDVDIAGIDMVINDDAMYVGLPGLSNQAIRTEIPSDAQIITMFNELYKVAPDEKVLKDLVVRYIMCMVDGIEDVEEENEVVSAGDVEAKYLKMTAKIDEAVVVKGFENVLTEAKEDEDIKKLITDFCNTDAVNEDPDAVYAEFQNGIDDLLSELNNADFSFDFDLNIWVDAKGDIIGMGIDSKEFEISYVNALKGKELGTNLSIKASTFNAEFEGTGEVKSNKFNGEYAFKIMGSPIIDVKVEDVDMKLMKDDVFNGQVVITPSSMVKSMLGTTGDELASLISEGEIVFKSEATEKYKGKSELSVYTGNEILISLKVDADKVAATKPSVNSYIDSDDYGAVEAWGNRLLSNLMSNLYRAGVPSYITN